MGRRKSRSESPVPLAASKESARKDTPATPKADEQDWAEKPNPDWMVGVCGFCDRAVRISGMNRHLNSCAARRLAEEAAIEKPAAGARRASGGLENLYHLQVRGRAYWWLHLEMRGSATLKNLDSYLRAIWLECCGHLSRFEIKGVKRPPLTDEQIFEWENFEDETESELGLPKTLRADDLLRRDLVLVHEYDFGDPIFLELRVLGMRRGRALSKHPIHLLARNSQPPIPCMKCAEPAVAICMECVIENREIGTLCEKHERAHRHRNYGRLPVVNSPRMGMCGYTGPADPPY